MTMVQITAMVATGILCVLCIICFAAVVRNEQKANENSKAIKDIEKSLSLFGDSIKEQTEQLIEHMEKQQPDEADRKRLDLLEEEIRQLTRLEEEAAAAAAAAEAEAAEEIGEIEELGDEIELDDLFRQLSEMAESEPVQPEPAPEEPQFIPEEPQFIPEEPQFMPEPLRIVPEPPVWVPAEPEEPEILQEELRTPTRYHQGYNIGRSGRKYTAEELNVLIRE